MSSSCRRGGAGESSPPRACGTPLREDERMRRHHSPGTPTKQGTCALVDGSMDPVRLYSSSVIVILQLNWPTIGARRARECGLLGFFFPLSFSASSPTAAAILGRHRILALLSPQERGGRTYRARPELVVAPIEDPRGRSSPPLIAMGESPSAGRRSAENARSLSPRRKGRKASTENLHDPSLPIGRSG